MAEFPEIPADVQRMIVQYWRDAREMRCLELVCSENARIQSIAPSIGLVWGSEFAVRKSNATEEITQRNDILFDAMLRIGFKAEEIPQFLQNLCDYIDHKEADLTTTRQPNAP